MPLGMIVLHILACALVLGIICLAFCLHFRVRKLKRENAELKKRLAHAKKSASCGCPDSQSN